MLNQDYYDDPQAPVANSMVVAVAVVVRDDDGNVLLISRTDNGLWALPGGAQDLGETTRQAAQREVEEETGLKVDITDLVGIYSDPKHVIAYDDGEVRQEFSIVFHAHPVSGQIPGMKTDFGSINEDVANTEKVHEQAQQVSPGEKVSTITWSDYKAPLHLPAATLEKYADDATGDLSQFQENLRATHEGGQP